MKIILVAPRSITRHQHQEEPYRFDYAFWNFYIPLMALGHNITFFDTAQYGDEQLRTLIENKKPDLLFCITTGDQNYCPQEPWETISQETTSGRTKTFNWFCDDSWRYDSFSSEACHHFNVCSTPEAKFVERYKKDNYNNILAATWHANSDLYSVVNVRKTQPITFVGALHGTRQIFMNTLNSCGIQVNHPRGASFEDLVWEYSRSQMGINFSKNSVNSETQMKARIFEIPAARTMLITEHHDEIEHCFKIDKEIITFETETELVEKLNFLLKNPAVVSKIALNGYKRFRAEHDSKIRLSKLLEQINKI